MNVRNLGLPFRVGTTSYILTDGLVANARFLAPQVQDMQLVLFDQPGGPSNLPDPTTVEQLAAIGRSGDLSYTIHLTEDVRLADDDSPNHPSLNAARRLIWDTLPLAPKAYVLHAEGSRVQDARTPEAAVAAWQTQAVTALKLVGEMAGGGKHLAVENLEGYPLDRLPAVAEAAAVCRCVDIGHLWLDGHDPLPYLTAALPSTQVIHLHGVTDVDGTLQDHASLAHLDPDKLDPVIALLMDAGYAGVVTLEVFEEKDFHTSMAALTRSVRRVRQGSTTSE